MLAEDHVRTPVEQVQWLRSRQKRPEGEVALATVPISTCKKPRKGISVTKPVFISLKELKMYVDQLERT